MILIIFLILFPLFISALLFLAPVILRKPLVIGASVVLAIASICLISQPATGFQLNIPFLDTIIFGLDILIGGYVLYITIKNKKIPAFLLALITIGLLIFFEYAFGDKIIVTHPLYIDSFSLLMALIISIVGGIICVFSLGYMPQFHKHYNEIKDRSRFFFGILFLFLSAMFGIVFSNHLLWLFLCFPSSRQVAQHIKGLT